MRRSPHLFAVVAVIAALFGGLLAACGDDDADSSSSEPGGNSGSAAYPVVIEHQFGSTTVESEPTRIVAFESSYIDALLALGVTPVGVGRFDYAEPGVAPWAEGLLDPAEVTLLDTTDGLPLEQIAALEPDLIFASYWVTDEVTLSQLEQIAPTVGLLGDGVDGSWQEVTEAVGRATGRSDEARALVAELEQQVAAVRADHPEREGATYALAVMMDATSYGVIVDPTDNATRFFADLGLELAPGISDLDATTASSISLEELGRLDGDLLFMGAFDESHVSVLEQHPLFATLPAVKADSYGVLDTATLVGLRGPSALSIPVLLAAIEPILGGDAS